MLLECSEIVHITFSNRWVALPTAHISVEQLVGAIHGNTIHISHSWNSSHAESAQSVPSTSRRKCLTKVQGWHCSERRLSYVEGTLLRVVMARF